MFAHRYNQTEGAARQDLAAMILLVLMCLVTGCSVLVAARSWESGKAEAAAKAIPSTAIGADYFAGVEPHSGDRETEQSKSWEGARRLTIPAGSCSGLGSAPILAQEARLAFAAVFYRAGGDTPRCRPCNRYCSAIAPSHAMRRRALARKVRSDSVLGNLPEADAEELATLFEQGWPLAKIRTQIALSREAGGFDLRVSLSTLSTWWNGQSAARMVQRMRRAAEESQRVAAAAGQASDLDQAILGAIRATIFDAVSKPGADVSAISALAGVLGDAAKLKLREAELSQKERRLAIQEDEHRIARDRALAELDRAANSQGLTTETITKLKERIAAL
jgi:hypothetical protein